MQFFAAPYDTLFAHKEQIFCALLLLAFGGLAFELAVGKRRSVRETLANVAIFFGNNAVNLFFAQALQLAALSAIAGLVPWELPQNALTLALGVLGIDFCYYWRHRWEHETAFLWAEHSVHHSSEEYNFATSLRLPVITPLFGWVFFTPLALLGFPAKLILASYMLNLLYQYWVHNSWIGRLGWLEHVLSTPSNHRVHHARNPEYIDKNYGGMFIVWDKLFGTYQPERAPPVYGLVHPIGTQNPVAINVRPYARLLARMRQESSWRGRARLLWQPPA